MNSLKCFEIFFREWKGNRHIVEKYDHRIITATFRAWRDLTHRHMDLASVSIIIECILNLTCLYLSVLFL